jgi:hypothetical protein
MITVDFRQSLALKVKKETEAKGKKTKKQEPILSPPVIAAEKPVSDPKPPTVHQEASKPEEKSAETKPVPETVTEVLEAEPTKVLKTKPMVPTALVGQTRTYSVEKTAKVVARGFKVTHEETVKVLPKTFQPLKPEPTAKHAPPPVHMSAASGKKFRPLKTGEGLLTLARSINPDTKEAFRIAVAVWQSNLDKFICGNMHGIHSGVELNLENLEERLASLDIQTAREILWSQWEDWKVIQKELSSPQGEKKADTGEREEILPDEFGLDFAGIFSVLADWQESWEEGNLPRHLAHFATQNGKQEGELSKHLTDFKAKMLRTHKEVRLKISNSIIYHKTGGTWVSFSQKFSSDKMESVGRKDIALIREEGEWKIISEKFSVYEHAQKTAEGATVALSTENNSGAGSVASPYVIHVSSHLDISTSTRVVNELRRKGLSAYLTPIPIDDKRKIYRVYVGRYNFLDVAREVTRQIRKLSIGKYAIPASAPYVLESGNYADEKKAREQIKLLRKKKLSPFLFITADKNFSQPRFRVLLGAFRQPESASKLSEHLSTLDVSFTASQP